MKKNAAFTLIELLVVIAIIALLAGIAIPVYTTITETAHSTTCANNMKQLGMGMVSYLNDNEDQMFSADGSNATPPTTWESSLQSKYVSDWRVFQSPFDKRTFIQPVNGAPANVSYGINSYAFTPGANQTGGTDYSGLSSQWVSPSELILIAPLCDSTTQVKFSGTSAADVKVLPGTPMPLLGTFKKRMRIGVCYGDAHINPSVLWRDFSDGTTNPSGLRRWQPLAVAP